jgi:hypothetical protein
MNLDPTQLRDIITAGPEAGLAVAQGLISGGQAGINEINSLQKQLDTVAATTAKTSTDAFYAAGINTAQGLVNGLLSQQAAIEQAMDHIADAMVERMKKKLKIKSPSAVLADEVGEPSGMGVIQGFLRTTGALGDATGAATDAMRNGGTAAGAAVAAQPMNVQVFIGEQELTQLVNTQVKVHNRSLRSRVLAGSKT